MTLRVQAIATWGVLGVVALLVQALWRLTPIAVEALTSSEMTPALWGVCVAWVVINAHAEGHRGFHKSFSPRVIARAVHLGNHPRPLFVALAPLFCMGLFHARRRVMVVAWSALVGVVALVVAIRWLEQPWRGIVDAGVVVGLGWGLVSLLWYYAQAVARGIVPARVDLPS